MLRGLDRRGVVSPRIDLYLGHCHLEQDEVRAAIRRYRRCVALMPAGSPQRAAPWIGLGLCYGRLGDIERATRAFRRAERLDPKDEEAQTHLIHCYALLGKVRRAEKHAEKAVALDPSSPHIFRHLAVAYLLDGAYHKALSAWGQVALRASDHPELDLGRARCWTGLGRMRKSRKLYLRATSGPYAAEAWQGLGDLEWRAGRLPDAKQQYRRALDLDEDLADARRRLAECHLLLGEPTEVEGLLEPLLSSDEDLAETCGLGAQARIAVGDRRGALRHLRRLRERAGTHGATWRVIGDRLLELGRLRFANRAYRRAIRLGDEGQAIHRLARGLARSGARKKSVSLLARASHARPDVTELHLDLAAAQMARGRLLAAERGLLRGLAHQPDSADLWAAAAEMALDQGRRRLARARLRSALRRNRRHPPAVALLLRWLIAEGEWARAAHAGRVAMRLMPETDTSWRDAGLALVRGGAFGEALAPLRQYVLANPSDPAGFELLGEAMGGLGNLEGAASQHRIAQTVRRLALA